MKVASSGTPETLILDVTRSTHRAQPYLHPQRPQRRVNGYIYPFLDNDNEQKTTASPSFRAVDAMLVSSSMHHRSPGLLVPSRSTDNHYHKCSISHTHHARVIPPGS
jgi:hypothetical protein